jgi:hypothetical protein
VTGVIAPVQPRAAREARSASLCCSHTKLPIPQR